MLTTTQLRKRWQGKDFWLSDGGPRGAGVLTARITRDGVTLYYRYIHQGRRRFLSLGPWNEKGKGGLALVHARERVTELTRLHRNGTTDLHEHQLRTAAAHEAAIRAQEEEALRALEAARHGTLQQLMDAYVAHLEKHGKQSVRDVRSLFARHVPADLARQRAASLTVDHFIPVVSALVEAGKGRTAGKLRSYLRAAYELALASRTDPTVPQSLRTFGVTSNPPASIKGLARFNRTRERNLTDSELAAYLRALEGISGRSEYIRDALTVALYLGGQRIEQLLRLEWGDVDIGARELVLYDGKGRRVHARVHPLPLSYPVRAILKRRSALAPYDRRVFVTAHPTTLTHTVADISAALVGRGLVYEPFELRDIRRTCETIMGRSPLKVPKHIRAHIQSHGLGGVQDRHYDRNEYMEEKREALVLWAWYLRTLRRMPEPDTEGQG
jgi:integrase